MSKRYKNKLQGAIEHLLYDICVTWGICIPPPDQERIMNFEFLEAEEFAIMVVEAEGLGKDSDFINKVTKKFIDKFGSEVSIESYENSRR